MNTIEHQAYRSEAFLLQLDGASVSEHDDYWVISFPRNPDFIWGNFLLLKAPPRAADFPRWIDISKKELGNTWFMAMGWQGLLTDTGELGPYTEFGFDFEQSDVLLCTQPVRPLKFSELQLRPCQTDEAWDRVLDMHKFLFARGKYKDTQIDFFNKRYQSFRRMAESGRGEYFEAFLGEEVVASFGLFHYEQQARFQEVVVYPRFRDMGFAQSMCFLGLEWAFREWQVENVLTIAELPEALGCYRNLGFQSVGIQEGMKWIDPRLYPKESPSTPNE